MRISMNWNRLIRGSIFGLLVAASAVAALMPGWATTLKAQGYTSYVDLHLDVQPGSPVLHAGIAADFLVTLANEGPADANRARTLALTEGAAVRKLTSGCTTDPAGFPDCELATPLPAGASADYLLTLGVPTNARGHVNLAVAAASDDVEAAPGQEFVLLQLPIEAHVNLHAQASCAQPIAQKNVPLACRVVLSNSGEATSLLPYFALATGAGGTLSIVSCSAPRPQLCANQGLNAWGVPDLQPGEAVTLDVQLDVGADFHAETTYLFAQIYYGAGGEIDDAPYDYYTEMDLPVPLFRDGFEGVPPAAPQAR